MKKSDLLIIIPAYNEEKNIYRTLQNIKNIKKKVEFDLIIIDDGSQDRTVQIAKNQECKVLKHPFNMGYGSALHTGFKYAFRKKYKQVIIMDSDGQHDPESIYSLLKCKKESQADVVIGSRFLSSSEYKMPLAKQIGRAFFFFFVFLFIGKKFTDPTSGLQLLTYPAFSYLANIDYPEDYPDADIVILLGLNQFKIEETRVIMKQREHGKSMHSGLKPFYYVYKVIISILSVFINFKLNKRKKNYKVLLK